MGAAGPLRLSSLLEQSSEYQCRYQLLKETRIHKIVIACLTSLTLAVDLPRE